MEYTPSSFDPDRLQSEARIETLAQGDPAIRLSMLTAMIEEGAQDMVGFALAALEEIPDTLPDKSDGVNNDKLGSAQDLLGALVQHRLFEDAETVAAHLGRLSPRDGLRGIATFLQAGYAGKNDAYLQLDFTAVIEGARRTGKFPSMSLGEYLSGLASFGVDLFDQGTDAGKLFADYLTVLTSRLRYSCYSNIGYAYAKGGHFEQAIVAKDAILEPFLRGQACAYIAGVAQDEGNSSLAEQLITETLDTLDAVACCDGSCERSFCNPAKDVQELQVLVSLPLAQQGNITGAYELIGQVRPGLAFDQARVHAYIYSQNGSMAARSAALSALMESSVFRKASRLSAFIRDIGEADQRWGNTLPSLVNDDEVIPLICWELTDLYGRKHRLQVHLETEGADDAEYQAMELLGIDPETFLGDIVKARSEQRDRTIAELAKLIAPAAPHSAANLIGMIPDPAAKVRAMVGISRLRAATETSVATADTGGSVVNSGDTILAELRRLTAAFRKPETKEDTQE